MTGTKLFKYNVGYFVKSLETRALVRRNSYAIQEAFNPDASLPYSPLKISLLIFLTATLVLGLTQINISRGTLNYVTRTLSILQTIPLAKIKEQVSPKEKAIKQPVLPQPTVPEMWEYALYANKIEKKLFLNVHVRRYRVTFFSVIV